MSNIGPMHPVKEIFFRTFCAIHNCSEPEVEFFDEDPTEVEDFWNSDRSEVLACKRYYSDGAVTYEVRKRLLPPSPEENFESKPSPFDGRGFWGNYKDNSVGRAINHIYHICGLHNAENAVFHGDGLITQGQETPFALVDWTKGYPVFTFVSDSLNKAQKAVYEQEGLDV